MTQRSPRNNTVAQRLRYSRELAGLTQAQAAKLLNLHRPSISEIEAGRRNVSVEELRRLAEVYAADLEWLVNGNESRSIESIDELTLAARGLSDLSDTDLDALLQVIRAIRHSSD